MRSAWRNRGLTTLAVIGFLAATGWLYPDSGVRAEKQYLFVIAIGYGHLIGAAVFGRDRMRRFAPTGVPAPLFAAFVATSTATLFFAYAWIAAIHPAFFVPLLAISLWHIVENDVAIARAYRASGALAPLGRSVRSNLWIAAVTAGLLLLGDALLRPEDYGTTLDGTIYEPIRSIASTAIGLDLVGNGWLGFGDFFSAVTLYHLVGFLVFFADRTRVSLASPREKTRRWRLLLWAHLPPIAACVALLATLDPRADGLRTLLFSPGIYLFWSVLHVAQTALARGLEEPERRAARMPVAS